MTHFIYCSVFVHIDNMGGCRCTFRNCKNSSQNSPKWHFFHYPARDMARCTKWAEYADRLDLLDLPFEKLRNKVVCEAHFTEPNFMNIKHERLIQRAIPTIMITDNGEKVDLASGDVLDVGIASTTQQTTKTSQKSPIDSKTEKPTPIVLNKLCAKNNIKIVKKAVNIDITEACPRDAVTLNPFDEILEMKPHYVEAKRPRLEATPQNKTSLSKVQLFNSIKKYLSPSMNALLRIEMFGGPEREYKKDEKQLAVDILNLGENVYNHFVDEWRIRLPPRREIEEWSDEVVTSEEEC